MILSKENFKKKYLPQYNFKVCSTHQINFKLHFNERRIPGWLFQSVLFRSALVIFLNEPATLVYFAWTIFNFECEAIVLKPFVSIVAQTVIFITRYVYTSKDKVYLLSDSRKQNLHLRSSPYNNIQQQIRKASVEVYCETNPVGSQVKKINIIFFY